jgi:hypothetical protein
MTRRYLGEVATHSAEWYRDQFGPACPFEPGDRMLIPCEGGGPSTIRLERFPPRLELEARQGMYVLEDEGPPDQWRYHFAPTDA